MRNFTIHIVLLSVKILLKRGEFVKVFGQVRHSTGRDGREYTNVKFLSEKLLKAKRQMKEQKKTSTLNMFKKYKGEVEKAKGEKAPEHIADMKKELKSLEKIADREMDHYYSQRQARHFQSLVRKKAI